MSALASPAGRTRRVLQQTAWGLVSRAGALVASFAAMPLMLHQLGRESLGVWLVLLSVFQWITFFDLGVAAGARNEIAKGVAANDHERTRSAISTGWLYTALVASALFGLSAITLCCTPFPNWLQTSAFGGFDARAALWVVAAGSCLSFALSYIQSVYAALEKASAFSLFSLLSNVGFLALLALASLLSSSDVFQVSVLYLLAMVGGNLWLIIRFAALHPEFRPRLASIDHRMRGRMLGFGIRLFVIQVAAMVIFTTSRLMASLFLGPASVVVYDAGFKIFSLVSVVHTLIMSTLWSSFTQAYERAEWDWIRSSLRRLTTLMLPLSIACVALAAVSPRLITIWLGPQQVGPPHLYFWFAAVTLLSCWSNIFAYFLNGIGNTRVQFVSAIVAAILNIPASYFFAVRLEQGVCGLLIGTLLSLALFSVAGPIQALGLLKKNSPR